MRLSAVGPVCSAACHVVGRQLAANSGVSQPLPSFPSLPNRWGFRRIEDICWIKTNRQREKEPDRKYLSAQHQNPHSTLVHTKVSCQESDQLPE